MILTDGHHQAIAEARKAFAMTLELTCGPGELMPLAVVAISGAFADIIGAVEKRSPIVDLINRQIRRSGFRLVPVERHA